MAIESSAATRQMSVFLERLMTEGVAAVFDEPGALSEDATCDQILVELESTARNELAGEGPGFSLETGRWAARILYQACKFVICRDFSEAEMLRPLNEPCPAKRSPEVDWSADLVFRHLPDVYRGARHLANADPLVKELMRLAKEWPLSSVGISFPDKPDLKSFFPHPALRRLYVDRILNTSDVSRLGDAAVD